MRQPVGARLPHPLELRHQTIGDRNIEVVRLASIEADRDGGHPRPFIVAIVGGDCPGHSSVSFSLVARKGASVVLV